MTDLHYWLWLQLGIGADADIKNILEHFASPKEVYDSSVLDWAVCDALSPARIDRLTRVSLDDADEIINECNKNGWDIITLDDERYPDNLKDISRPPAVLYVCGNIECLQDRLAVGMVGTRKAAEYSQRAAQYLAKGIAECGAVIISGGALGVDSASHEGALEAGGLTVAVLGCGLGSDYLKSNKQLRSDIVDSGGALITEYPPYTKADKTTFPTRNRIISGLSRCVIVVEAAKKSGSLITADFAHRQGRDVFAVPASIFDPAFQGTNMLIDEGAYVATSPLAVLRRYADEYYTLDLSKVRTMYKISENKYGANAPESKQIDFDSVSRTEDSERQDKAAALIGVNRTVYDSLGGDLLTPDEIEDKTGLSNIQIITALTVLEVQGLVRKAEGDRYARA